MENTLNNDKTHEIYNYFKEIFEFENQLEKIYSNYEWSETHYVFIVKLQDYKAFKDNLFYDILKKYNQNEETCKNKINEFLESGKINNIKKIDKVFIKTSEELIELINKNNEYILISLKLGSIICKETISKRFYIYLHDCPEIILTIDINDSLIFACNKSIINKDSYKDFNENNKLINIAKAIIEYYNFENIIIKNLKNSNQKNSKEMGYLVNKKWIDEWKQYINYEKIQFLAENKEEQINNIKKQILYLYNYEQEFKKPNKIKLEKFKYRTILREHLKSEPLAIINHPFYQLISKSQINQESIIWFSFSDGRITIDINKKPIVFKCNNNIINSNNEDVNLNENPSNKGIVSKLKDKLFGNKNMNKDKQQFDNDIKDELKPKSGIKFEDEYVIIEKKNTKEIDEDKKEEINVNKENIIKEEKKKKPEIKNNFIDCPNIGLQNIGATCYMNSTLQCFCHIEKFVNFFKYNPQVANINNDDNNLSSSFKILINKLWPDNYNNFNKIRFYAPEEFKKKISKMNNLFEGIAANDAKDLVNFIIMTLHSELNKANYIEENNNENFDQANKKLVFDYFAKDFTNKNKSIISDLFYSINCSVTECLNCHNKLYNYQTYFFIIFPLEEVRKFIIEKNKNMMMLQFNQFNQYNQFYYNNINNINNNEVSINDCFDYDKKVNVMSGSNSMYCNNCKINCDGAMYSYLVTGPEVLILVLNRGKGIQFNVKINFKENLDLNNYIEYKNTGANYKLIGVITHIGESSMNGHFIAYCRDPISKKKWFKYNDAIVNEVYDFNEIINFAMPYLLFYQKIN